MIWTKSFWKGAAERALKTFFQTAAATAAVFVTGDLAGIMDVDWVTVGSVSALATVLSLATSIGNADFTSGEQNTEVVIVTPEDADTATDHVGGQA